MDITNKEILKSTHSRDVWKWIKEHPDEDHTEAAKLFNELRRKEFESRISNFDPNTHYEVW